MNRFLFPYYNTRTTVRTGHSTRQSSPIVIANRLEISKSSVYKHLKTLEEGAVRDRRRNDMSDTGLRLLNLDVGARRRRRIDETAKSEIRRSAEEYGEMANLLVEERGRGIFLHRADSSRATNLDTHAGREVYHHTTALGKVILAGFSDGRVSDVIER